MFKRIRKAWKSRATKPLHPFIRTEGMRKLSASNIQALNAAIESSSPVSFSIGIGYFPSEPLFPKRWVQRTKQGGFLISNKPFNPEDLPTNYRVYDSNGNLLQKETPLGGVKHYDASTGRRRKQAR